jgi:hypothetical protein
MQILYNNLNKAQGRSKSKKKSTQKFTSGSQDFGNKRNLIQKTNSQSSKGFTILSNRNQTPLERKL